MTTKIPTLADLTEKFGDSLDAIQEAADAASRLHLNEASKINRAAGLRELNASEQRKYDAFMENVEGLDKFVSERRLAKVAQSRAAYNMDGVVNATQDNYVLAYGDFFNFVIVDRIGTTIELIPNLMGANARPTGRRGLVL
ncbi:hypothetical protein [Micromonospora pallida]|uniref:hypothetical protein n=1 Tax=Micromonospora pallida TaxID=145854 RepID=UPI00159EFAFB|nr:hypothetical protein [Micromonospora pallida]